MRLLDLRFRMAPLLPDIFSATLETFFYGTGYCKEPHKWVRVPSGAPEAWLLEWTLFHVVFVLSHDFLGLQTTSVPYLGCVYVCVCCKELNPGTWAFHLDTLPLRNITIPASWF